MRQTKVDKKQLRSFGLIVGGLFVLIGMWPLAFRGEAVRLWAMVPGSILLIQAALLPSSLQPFHRAWMFIGHILGWVNTRIILGILFYGVFTPTGLIIRLFGNDPMRRRYDPNAATYRINRSARASTHVKNQF